MKARIKQIIKTVNSGTLRIPVRDYTVEVYWPHLNFTLAEDRLVVGGWAKTLIVIRKDNNWLYKWAAAVAVLGFGFGLSKKPDQVDVP